MNHLPGKNGKKITIAGILLVFCTMLSSCGIYTFRDVSIPDTIKTIKINYIENRASIINPQLSPKLTDQFKQTVQSYVRKATLVNTDNADYIINSYISNYTVSTSGIGTSQATTNRLTVGVTMTLNNTVKGESHDYSISRDFDFSASLTLSQAENQLLPDILKNLSDEMFNRIFSGW